MKMEPPDPGQDRPARSEEHTSELQSRRDFVCRLLLEKKKHGTQLRTEAEELSVPAPRAICSNPGITPALIRCVVAGIDHHVSLFFFNDPATTEIYTLSLHDALPI